MHNSTSSLSCLCCQAFLYLHLRVVCLPLAMNIDEQIRRELNKTSLCSNTKEAPSEKWKSWTHFRTTSQANEVKLIYVADTRRPAIIEFQYLDVGWGISWSLRWFLKPHVAGLGIMISANVSFDQLYFPDITHFLPYWTSLPVQQLHWSQGMIILRQTRWISGLNLIIVFHLRPAAVQE